MEVFMDINKLRDCIVTRSDEYIFVTTPEGVYAFERSEAGVIFATNVFVSIEQKFYKPGMAERHGKFVGNISDDAKQLFDSIGVTKAYEEKIAYEKSIAEKIQANPNDATVYFHSAHYSLNKGDRDKAIADFTKAILFNPDYADAYLWRATIYGERKNYDKAIADLTEVIRLKPNDATAYLRRATIYKEREDYSRAVADYEMLVKLNVDGDYRKSLEEVKAKLKDIEADQRKSMIKLLIHAAVAIAVFFLLRTCMGC
jgi:tetratricopeptide (TPR) repeat protein